MAARQEGAREMVANPEHLAHEKVLSSTEQQLLAQMTSDLQEKLGQCCVHHRRHLLCVYMCVEVASSMLDSLEQYMKQSLRELLDNSTTVRENIQLVRGHTGEGAASDRWLCCERVFSHTDNSLAEMQRLVESISSDVHSRVIGHKGRATKGHRYTSYSTCTHIHTHTHTYTHKALLTCLAGY